MPPGNQTSQLEYWQVEGGIPLTAPPQPAAPSPPPLPRLLPWVPGALLHWGDQPALYSSAFINLEGGRK